LAPISPNKNEGSSYQNLKTMIKAINLHLLKYVVKAITSPKMKPILPLEMKKKLVDDIGEPLNTSNNLALRIS
jgi:hypothetical protein